MALTPLALLNNILGHWSGYRWDNASLTEDEVDLTFFADALKQALTERQYIVLKLRYWHGHTLENIGFRYKVTGNRIRGIECSAIRRMRIPYNLQHVRRAVVGTFNAMRDMKRKPTSIGKEVHPALNHLPKIEVILAVGWD